MLFLFLSAALAVTTKGEECTCVNYQVGLKRGGSACQFGPNNCSMRQEGEETCPGNGVACCIDRSIVCKCLSYQSGAKNGDEMCEFQGGNNCAFQPQGETRCSGGGRKCILSIDEGYKSYCDPAPEVDYSVPCKEITELEECKARVNCRAKGKKDKLKKCRQLGCKTIKNLFDCVLAADSGCKPKMDGNGDFKKCLNQK